MVQELNYTAETFDICVDGKTYAVNTSRLYIIQRMQQFCESVSAKPKADIVGFVEEMYKYLKAILGEDVFASVFAGKEYDVVFLSEFGVYLAEMAKPHIQKVTERLAKLSEKYSRDNLNEPADPQIAES